MESTKKFLAEFFGVAVKGQTYLNALYLLLAFPLGLFYFIFLVTGLALGVSLVIVWVGLLLLLIVFGVWYTLLMMERWMAITMLHEDIPPMSHDTLAGKSVWQKLKTLLSNPVTWKGLLYLFAKFPLGILSFVVLVTLISISVSLIAAPFYYPWVHPNITLDLGSLWLSPVWMVDSLPKALVACLFGILAALVSMHICNSLAWLSGRFARIMLGNFSAQPASPAALLAPAE
jgi:hypothetical protein